MAKIVAVFEEDDATELTQCKGSRPDVGRQIQVEIPDRRMGFAHWALTKQGSVLPGFHAS